MRLLCYRCYRKEHKVKRGYKCEMSCEKFICDVCGKKRYIVVNVYDKNKPLLNFGKQPFKMKKA